MPVPSSYQHQRQGKPSCWELVKRGFGMGVCVGLASGVLFGGFTGLRAGLRGRELLSVVGKTMLQSAGAFGIFMAIGTGGKYLFF